MKPEESELLLKAFEGVTKTMQSLKGAISQNQKAILELQKRVKGLENCNISNYESN